MITSLQTSWTVWQLDCSRAEHYR